MTGDELMLDVREVCRITQLGRTSIYEEMNSGRLRSIKVCGRRLIPRVEVERWASNLITNAETDLPHRATAPRDIQ